MRMYTEEMLMSAALVTYYRAMEDREMALSIPVREIRTGEDGRVRLKNYAYNVLRPSSPLTRMVELFAPAVGRDPSRWTSRRRPAKCREFLDDCHCISEAYDSVYGDGAWWKACKMIMAPGVTLGGLKDGLPGSTDDVIAMHMMYISGWETSITEEILSKRVKDAG